MPSKVTFKDELLFPSDYLAAVDLHGKDLTVTIAGIAKESLRLRRGGSQVKPLLSFQEHPKKVVLNKTNAESISIALGSTKAEAWIGKQVTFYPTTCLVGRETVDCIRVRETIQQPNGELIAPVDPNEQIEKIGGLFEKLGWTTGQIATHIRNKYRAESALHMTPKDLNHLEASLTLTIAQREAQKESANVPS